MRVLRWTCVGMLLGAGVVGSSGPASAHLDGGCQASGTWRNAGISVDAIAIGDEVVTVPRSDTVDWMGSVSGPPGEHSGAIWLELPPPFGTVEIDNWGGSGETTSNSGSEDYDLPKLLPAGVIFTVAGEHSDANGNCTGYVNLKLEGSALSSPITWVSLAATVGLGAALFMLLKPLFQGNGMGLGGILGTAVLGLFFMLFLALDLVMFGAIPLNSAMVTALPLIGLAGGGAGPALLGRRPGG